MNKSYVSPVKLAILALVCCVSVLNSGFNAAFVTVVAASCFLLGIVIVSGFEKLTNSHVRFVIFALVVTALITILKYVLSNLEDAELKNLADALDYAVFAAFVMSVLPIYFVHTTTKAYYISAVKTAFVFILTGTILGLVVEFLGNGTLFGYYFNAKIFDFNNNSLALQFLLLAFVCMFGLMIEKSIMRKKAEERFLIDKYKYLIRESQIERLKKMSENSLKKEGGKN